LKPEWWGSPLVKRGKVPGKTCEKIRNNNVSKVIKLGLLVSIVM
jgi:hypothetical protein